MQPTSQPPPYKTSQDSPSVHSFPSVHQESTSAPNLPISVSKKITRVKLLLCISLRDFSFPAYSDLVFIYRPHNLEPHPGALFRFPGVISVRLFSFCGSDILIFAHRSLARDKGFKVKCHLDVLEKQDLEGAWPFLRIQGILQRRE